MRRNAIFVASLLVVVGLAVVLLGFLTMREVSGYMPISHNQPIRDRANTEFAVGIILTVVGLLVGLIYGRSPEPTHT